MLRRHGHECWTAGAAGLARARDDELTVWAAEHQAVLVSTDGEFGQRRMQNAIGRHVWLAEQRPGFLRRSRRPGARRQPRSGARRTRSPDRGRCGATAQAARDLPAPGPPVNTRFFHVGRPIVAPSRRRACSACRTVIHRSSCPVTASRPGSPARPPRCCPASGVLFTAGIGPSALSRTCREQEEMMRTLGYATAITMTVAGTALGVLAVKALPDMRRYMAMRKM